MTREYKTTRNYTTTRVYRDRHVKKPKKVVEKLSKLSFLNKFVNGIKKFFNK